MGLLPSGAQVPGTAPEPCVIEAGWLGSAPCCHVQLLELAGATRRLAALPALAMNSPRAHLLLPVLMAVRAVCRGGVVWEGPLPSPTNSTHTYSLPTPPQPSHIYTSPNILSPHTQPHTHSHTHSTPHHTDTPPHTQ